MRSVKLKTSKGVVTRSVQRLHDLEINKQPSNIEHDTSSKVDSSNDNVFQTRSDISQRITRSGRVVKQPIKLVL